MKLKHLPIGLAAALILLGSGTAFAAYQLWLSPSAQVRTTKYTDKVGQALLRLKNCPQLGKSADVTIDPKSGLDAAQGAKVIQAYCETSAVQQWAMSALHVQSSDILLPYTITSISGSTAKVSYQGDTRTLALSPKTAYISGGSYGSRAAFRVGDSIAYVSTADNSPVQAMIKLSLMASYYGNAMQQDISLNDPCPGNPGELCPDAESIPLHPYSEAGANPNAKGISKIIVGKLVSYTDSSIVLKSSSGALYTVYATENLVNEFNTQSGQTNYYFGITITTGDTLEAYYIQPANADGHVIASDELEDIELFVTGNAKTGPMQKY